MALKLYFWQYRLKAKKERGFTLLELLIVVIIVGILGAVAIPNLLAQVGKARESEAKNTIATVIRTQQSYFMQNGSFATVFDDLEISVVNQTYYNYAFGISPSGGSTISANGRNNAKNGTRSYIGGVQYDTSTRIFKTMICRSVVSPSFSSLSLLNHGIVNSVTANPMRCGTGVTEEVK